MISIKKVLGLAGLIWATSFILSVNMALFSVMGTWLVIANVTFVVAAAISMSHFSDSSIPGARRLLRRAYYRAKFKRDQKQEAGFLNQVYIQFLAYMILLFKSADEGFEVIKEEAHELYSDAFIFVDKHAMGKNKKLTREYLKQLFEVHIARQKRAVAVMVSSLGVFVVGVLTIGLVSNMIFFSML